MRIVFMGTPDFAVESLKALIEKNFNVVGVVTMPDKPAGRGHKIQFSPVKKFAVEKNIQVLQPVSLKSEDFIAELRDLKADLQIVVAFRMLPEVVWNMPPKGTFNLHASLLPQYRGAAPINWAVINGETETGVSTFFLQHEIDTGGIILQQKVKILATDNAGDVHDKLMYIGAELVCKTVRLILNNECVVKDQSEYIQSISELKSAPKIFRDTCLLHPQMTVEKAHLLVRGMSPYPTAWAEIKLPGTDESLVLKVFESEVKMNVLIAEPGAFVVLDKKECGLQLKDGILLFKNVQAPGKKRMGASEWLRGIQS